MNEKQYQQKLKKLYDESPEFTIGEDDKIVVFSDLHLGNGGRKDDFKHNSELFSYILENNYLKKNYKLVLNGDIEDLYKFDIDKIYEFNKGLYALFRKFNSKGNFFKLIGNHDYTLQKFGYPDLNKKLLQSIKFNYNENSIFIYHGHQVSNFIDDYNYLSYFLIRYIISPLNIKNTTVSINSKKKIDTERRAFNFSESEKIISIIGHTHRPLFESLSRIDTLQMKIESLIRKYPRKDIDKQDFFNDLIKKSKDEIDRLYQKNNSFNLRNGIYNDKLLIPCLFNSGSGIGKRGITGIEIRNGRIALAYWFDSKRSSRYLNYESVKCKKLNGTDYYKAILKSEPLSYVFTRIKLLA